MDLCSARATSVRQEPVQCTRRCPSDGQLYLTSDRLDLNIEHQRQQFRKPRVVFGESDASKHTVLETGGIDSEHEGAWLIRPFALHEQTRTITNDADSRR
jgi:hypothetical protein